MPTAWFDGCSMPAPTPIGLREENEQLRQELRSQMRSPSSENARLRGPAPVPRGAMLPGGLQRGVAAAVIARPAGPYAQVDRGRGRSKDGVKVGDPVVTQDGLVGRVTRVAGARRG